MTRFVGLDVSQKMTSICVVDETGRRIWRGRCSTDPDQLERMIKGHAGMDARVGLETGPMTPWLVHALRERGSMSSVSTPDMRVQRCRCR